MNSGIQIVTLENVYANASNRQAAELFTSLLSLRADGYGPPDYDPHVLPFDMTDFVGWHHLFCRREQGRLVPIGGFKQVLLETCDAYHQTFPLIAIARGAEAQVHEQVVSRILNEARASGRPVTYGGSWTIRKQLRTDNRELAMFLRELTAALFCMDQLTRPGTLILGLATLRFKADKYFESIGSKRLLGPDGEPLPVVGIRHANDEQVAFIEIPGPSDWARACYEKYQLLLRSRLLIGGPAVAIPAAKAG